MNSCLPVHEINHSKQVQEAVTSLWVPNSISQQATATVLSHNMGPVLIHVRVRYPLTAASCSVTRHERDFLGFTSKTKASVLWLLFRIIEETLACEKISHISRVSEYRVISRVPCNVKKNNDGVIFRGITDSLKLLVLHYTCSRYSRCRTEANMLTTEWKYYI